MGDDRNEDDDLEIDADLGLGPDVMWGVVTLLFAIGCAKVAADLTDVHGPGYVAFAIALVVAELVVRAIRRRW